MLERRRVKHEQSLEIRLADGARQLREKAKQLPPGAEREALLRKARNNETAANITGLLASPDLHPPR
ncbi:hypothetical protein [Bradyrhizobium genosp. P]|uniref:hypothetical protein n=1 Tax=Bradyrhizobium genosp. P TaxID=83641 RepID=UPI003CF03A8C